MSILFEKNRHNIQTTQNEQRFAQEWIQDLVNATPGFQWVPSLEVSSLEPTNTIKSKQAVGIKLKPKWGFILYHGQVVCLLESIFQSTGGTAIERCYRWLAVANLPQLSIPTSRMVFAFYGPQFNRDADGCLPNGIAKTLQICAANHINLLINPSLDEVEDYIEQLLEQIQQQYLSIAAK